MPCKPRGAQPDRRTLLRIQTRTRAIAERDRERHSGVQIHMSFDPYLNAIFDPEYAAYSDFLTFSDTVAQSTIDDAVKTLADEMAYKWGQSINAMINATVEAPSPPTVVLPEATTVLLSTPGQSLHILSHSETHPDPQSYIL